MFERYTEKARRVIFFARYDACQYGADEIAPEHVLLGLIREDASLQRWLPKMTLESFRAQIDAHLPRRAATSTAIDLPLDVAAKRVLKFAAAEADRLNNRHIGTEHLLLGLLDEGCFAAKVLREAGADASSMRAEFAEQNSRHWPPFHRGSGYNRTFRTSAAETIEIHGANWSIDYVHDAIHLCRTYNWHWHKADWKPRDVVIERKTGRVSFDLTLVIDSENFALAKAGWKKDHCFICRWELFESPTESGHGSGYTNGHDWLCIECYGKFWERPDYFSSSYSDIT
jgi:hypothetical protein